MYVTVALRNQIPNNWALILDMQRVGVKRRSTCNNQAWNHSSLRCDIHSPPSGKEGVWPIHAWPIGQFMGGPWLSRDRPPFPFGLNRELTLRRLDVPSSLDLVWVEKFAEILGVGRSTAGSQLTSCLKSIVHD